MFLLSITSALSSKRWFVNCITAKFALALSDRIVGVEKMVWHWGHLSPMKVFSWNGLSKIYLEVQNSAWCVPTWTIERLLRYWYKVMMQVLQSGTWKITNLNYTILPRQAFPTDTIYNGVASNYYRFWSILTFLVNTLCKFNVILWLYFGNLRKLISASADGT